MNVRPPRGTEERLAARSICDAAMLDLPEYPTWLVAVEGERVLGALALVGQELEAVAVRPGRRGQGIGTALVEAAAERRPRLVAEFDSRVYAFYESLGFDVDPAEGTDRYRGILD